MTKEQIIDELFKVKVRIDEHMKAFDKSSCFEVAELHLDILKCLTRTKYILGEILHKKQEEEKKNDERKGE